MNDEILDLGEFLERVQDDKELLLELLDIFSQDYEQKRVALQTAVESKDYEQIRSIGHSLKGASGNISAKALRAIFLRIEDMGKNSDLSGIDDASASLDKEYEALSKRIVSLKEELK